MNRKLTLLLAAILLFPAAASADMGIGLKAGAIRNSTDLILLVPSGMGNYSGDYTENNGIYGGELFYEADGLWRWGVKLGFELNPKSTYDEDLNGSVSKYTYKTMYIPATAYYKYAPEDSAFNYWAGGGIGLMKVTYTSLNSSSDYTQTKIVPHLDAGAEWSMSKHFGLGLNLGYLFGAKFDDLRNADDSRALIYDTPGNNPMYVNNEGLRGDITLRYYF